MLTNRLSCAQSDKNKRGDLNKLKSIEHLPRLTQTTTLNLRHWLFMCAVILSMILGSVQLARAQDSKAVKDNIERLESVEITSKSEMVRDIYKRSLLRLYEQYVVSLQQEITDLKSILASVGGSDSRMAGEIADNIKRLQSEQSITNEKILTLSADLRGSGPSNSSQNESKGNVSSRTEPSYTEGSSIVGKNSGKVSSENSGSVESNNDQNSSAQTRPGTTTSFLRPISIGNVTGNSPTPIPAAPFEIIAPSDQYTTELNEIEVFVELDSPASMSVPLKWEVQNNGKEFATGLFTIREGRRAEKIAVPLRPGGNEIIVTNHFNSNLSKTVTVTRGTDRKSDNAGSEAGSTALQGGAAAAADPPKTPFTRAIFGLEQAAAASANPEQKLFLEFNLTAPIFRKGNEVVDAPLWLWLNPRLTSLPKQISGSVAEFSTASNFISPFTSGKVNEIVQGFEFLGGFEVPLSRHGKRVTGDFASGFGNDIKTRIGLSLVAGAGMSTPFSPQKTLQVFKVNQTVIDQFPGAQGKEFIAFVSGDRNRFFRQYYGGLRLKSYFVKKGQIDTLENIFPGIIDVTFGQNEAVTGGELHGGVVRIDGIYPFPFAGGGSIYVFGSALMKLRHAKITAPVILQPADATVQVPGANVFIQQLPTRDTDHYRLGVGVDLIRLLKKKG